MGEEWKRQLKEATLEIEIERKVQEYFSSAEVIRQDGEFWKLFSKGFAIDQIRLVRGPAGRTAFFTIGRPRYARPKEKK